LLSSSTAKTAPRRWMRWQMHPTRRTWFDCIDRGWPYHQKIPIADVSQFSVRYEYLL
jgi:hypothetical protein